jgi:hypothetical protein
MKITAIRPAKRAAEQCTPATEETGQMRSIKPQWRRNNLRKSNCARSKITSTIKLQKESVPAPDPNGRKTTQIEKHRDSYRSYTMPVIYLE